MQKSKDGYKRKKSFRALLIGFLLVTQFSVVLFMFLMARMESKSKDAAMNLANLYIEKMNDQTIKHFKTAIDIKLSQVESIIKTMPPDGELQGEELRESMVVSGMARKFRFLALMDESKNMEILFGYDDLEIPDIDAFASSLGERYKDIAWAVSEGSDEGVVLLGVHCEYEMANGARSIAMVGGIDVDFVKDTLSLGDRYDDSYSYSYIIRQNGDFVIKGDSVTQDNFYERQYEIVTGNEEKSTADYVAEIKDAIESERDYTIMLPIGDEFKYLYLAPLGYADWSLITITSYSLVDEIILKLDHQRTRAYLLSIFSMIIMYAMVFFLFYELTKKYITQTDAAAEEALRANKAKSEFLSNMSHDIRTPMNVIVGMTEILLRNNSNPTDRKYLINIKNSSSALLTLINNILDFSKIESGNVEIIEEEYDIMSLLNDLGMSFLNVIGNRPVELLFDVDRELPKTLCGDVGRIRQILVNLINNAIKFTESGAVELCIRVEKTDAEDRIVLNISVKDTGQGIKKEDLEKLFHSFQQVDTKKNRNKEGTGLGLSISKQLVERMGGEISVRSEYGVGTEFNFTLPQRVVGTERAAVIKRELVGRNIVISAVTGNPLLAGHVERLAREYELNYIDWHNVELNDEHVDFLFIDGETYLRGKENPGRYKNKVPEGAEVCIIENPITENYWDAQLSVVNKPLYSLNFCQTLNHEYVEENLGEEEEGESFTAPDAKILIVDDTPMNLEVAVGLLKPLNMKIHTVDSGRRAIDMLKRNHYDIVFMDHMMPEMDGIETTQKIRSMGDSYLSTVPIIALTANAVLDARESFKEAGMNDFVAKPIDFKKICQKIKKWLPSEKICMHDVQQRNKVENVDDVQTDNVRTDEAQSGSAQVEQEPELPVIKGIDVSEGIKNSGSRELFMKLLGDFYRLIDVKSSKIEQCLADGMIREYTVEVHAMKSASRIIGALELSEYFFKMEQCGNAEDIETLQSETPKLMEMFRGYKAVLEPYANAIGGDRQETAREELLELLQNIYDAADGSEPDKIESAYKQFEKCVIPEKLSRMTDKLKTYVSDMAVEEIKDTCRAMIERLNRG